MPDIMSNEPKKGEVWWAKNMKFDNDAGAKSRPVVVISCDGETARVKICTTKSEGFKQRTEILDPIFAGLDDKQSYVVNEIKEVSRQKLSRKLGELCIEDREALGL